MGDNFKNTGKDNEISRSISDGTSIACVRNQAIIPRPFQYEGSLPREHAVT